MVSISNSIVHNEPFHCECPTYGTQTLVPLPASVPHMGQDDFKVSRQFFRVEIKWKSICGICCSVSKHKLYLYICVQEAKFYLLRNIFLFSILYFFFFSLKMLRTEVLTNSKLARRERVEQNKYN